MQVVTDHTGKIIAAAHAHQVSADGAHTAPSMQLEFRALDGQKIHEVEVPQALQTLHPHDRLKAVLEHAVHASGTCLEPRDQTGRE
jgi:hypothetical protein